MPKFVYDMGTGLPTQIILTFVEFLLSSMISLIGIDPSLALSNSFVMFKPFLTTTGNRMRQRRRRTFNL